MRKIALLVIFFATWLHLLACLGPCRVAYAAEATVTAEGCFLYDDFDGDPIPIRNTEVIMYDYDCVDTDCVFQGPLDVCREEMGRGTTGDDGCFEFTGTAADPDFCLGTIVGDRCCTGIYDSGNGICYGIWIDIELDFPDPYVQIIADSDAAVVQAVPLVNYCLRSGRDDGSWIRGRREQAEDGAVINFGNITPTNGTACFTDCWNVIGQDAAWDLFNLANAAHDFMRTHTLATNDEDVPKVTVQYPSGLPNSFYLLGFNTIMYSENNADSANRQRTLFHEYGHHVMYRFFTPILELVYPTWEYCNDSCDGLFNNTYSDICGHCAWRPENEPISWAEGWPHFISMVLCEEWGSDPDNQYTFDPQFENHVDPGCGSTDGCPQPGDDYHQIEGYVAAILWDLYDDRHYCSTSGDLCSVDSDCPDFLSGETCGDENHDPQDSCSITGDHCSFNLDCQFFPPETCGESHSRDRSNIPFSDMWEALFFELPPLFDCENIFNCLFHNNVLNLGHYWYALSELSPDLGFPICQVSEVYHENHIDAPAPNLMMIEISDPPTPIVRGEAFQITDTTMNFSGTIPGIPTMLNSTTRFFLHTDSTITWNDIRSGTAIAIGQRTIPNLGGWEESTDTTTVIFPANGVPGIYHLYACADADEIIFERNDTEDNNCLVASSTIEVLFEDSDGDGYRADVDCDDNNPAINPVATETCNGADDNCDGNVDEGFNVDGDGYRTCDGDCDDNNPAINPGAAEACNGADDDCDGKVDEGFDQDVDSIADCFDNCPSVSNPDQTNLDNDAEGDACDPDDDNDGTDDGFDNCPRVANADQANNDGDEQGDLCDPDDDNDGVQDTADSCPFEDATGSDADLDGCLDSLSGLTQVIGSRLEEEIIDEQMRNRLLSKLENIDKSVTKDNICAAINQLQALKNKIKAQEGKKITVETAILLMDYVDNLTTKYTNMLPEGESC